MARSELATPVFLHCAVLPPAFVLVYLFCRPFVHSAQAKPFHLYVLTH